MTKVINTDSLYNAVPSVQSGPDSVIHPVNFQNIAASQARVYEVLTGLGSDGGAVEAGNTPHDHTNLRSLPFVTLVSKSWGNENSSDNRPFTYANSNDTSYDVPVVYVPFYVPSGLDGACLLVVLHMDGNASRLTARLETWSGGPPMTPTPVTGSLFEYMRPGTEHPALADLPDAPRLLWCRLYPATAGQVHTLRIEDDLIQLDAYFTDPMWRTLRALTVMVEPSWGNLAPPDVPKPDLPTSNLIDVGDSRNANGWTCPTDTLVPENGPGPSATNPAVRFMALNDAWLQEKALGLPASGQATLTVSAGHNHDGTSANGIEIDHAVFATPTGRWSDYNGTPLTWFQGNGAIGPEQDDNTDRRVLSWEFYTPQNDNALSGKMKVAALMYADAAKSGAVVKVKTLAGTGDETTATCATDAGLSGAYELVVGDIDLNFTSGGLTDVQVTLASVVNPASETCALVGICFWIVP